jgi:predicted  nucleic acid-binding Zn-ribbon protein
MTDQLDHLRRFDRSMRELRRATELLNGLPEEMRSLHEEHSAAQRQLEALAAEGAAAQLDRRTAEGQVADAQERLKKFQQQVSRVRNQREYGALLTEIDAAKSALRGLEETTLAAIERAESAAAALVERRQGFEELATRYQAALAAWEAEKPAVAARVAELERETAELRAGLPQGVVAQFLRIVERFGEGMAPIQATERPGGGVIWHCGACNYRIRPQVAVEIKTRGSLVQCDGCRRFLHAGEE